ncbi:MAG: aminotransferase class I/II-fold pyridoxal phosphate-dependent enzyme [Frankiaceae bacterium]|jgi:cystathionine beta-lyase|nr:aminotransferase class I/II-fold pyridoxal phosphate-dependent enzyme [Frankiaceae bacterium]
MTSADSATEARFDAITAERLRAIGGSKWTRYGPDVLGAFVAEMDFGAAPAITEALRTMVEDARFGYVSLALNERLARATAQRYRQRFGWDIEPDWVHPAPDVLKTLEIAIGYFSRPGSPVVLPTPAYMPFLSVPPFLGRQIIEVPMIDEGGRYRFDLEGLAAAFAAGGHMLILCNPYNPLGRVFSREELLEVCEVVEAGGGRVFSDEIHAPLVFPGHEHVPYASICEAAAGHTVTGASASKAWNLAGLKCAQLILSAAADRELWEEISFSAHGASAAGVIANIAAYESGQPWLDAVLGYLDGSRRHLGELLAEHLPEVRYVAPEGTYLAWLDFRAYDLGEEVAAFFIDRAKVAMNNGAAFGAPGAGFARFNFAAPRPLVRQMIAAMGQAVRR